MAWNPYQRQAPQPPRPAPPVWRSPAPAPRPGLPALPLWVAWVAAGLALAVVATVIAVLAAGHSPKRPRSDWSPGPPPVGYTEFTDRTDGVAMSVPAAWQQVDLAGLDTASALQAFEDANPVFRSALGSQSPAQLGLQFLARSPDATETVDLVTRPFRGAGDAQVAAPEFLASLQERNADLGVIVTNHQIVALAGHRVLRLDGSATAHLPGGGDRTASVTQYFLAANDTLYSVELTGDSPDLAAIAGTLSVA